MLLDGILHTTSPGRLTYPYRHARVLAILLSAIFSLSAHGGDLLVASFSNGKIVRFAESNGAYLGDFVSTGSGGLTSPHALGFGPNGHLYVATFSGRNVLRYNGTTGAPLPSSTGAIGTAEFVASGAGGLSLAAGMDFGPDGNLYVSDHATSRVLRYDRRIHRHICCVRRRRSRRCGVGQIRPG